MARVCRRARNPQVVFWGFWGSPSSTYFSGRGSITVRPGIEAKWRLRKWPPGCRVPGRWPQQRNPRGSARPHRALLPFIQAAQSRVAIGLNSFRVDGHRAKSFSKRAGHPVWHAWRSAFGPMFTLVGRHVRTKKLRQISTLKKAKHSKLAHPPRSQALRGGNAKSKGALKKNSGSVEM